MKTVSELIIIKILIVLVATATFGFVLIQAHEDTHVRVYEITGCTIEERNLFSVVPKDCPNPELTNKLTAQVEYQYLHIWAYTMIFMVLLMNIMRGKRND